MRGEITLKILEILEEAATTAVDLTTAILNAGYGASFNKINREFERRHFQRESRMAELKEFIEERRRLSKLIYKLKKEGLIVHKETAAKNGKLTLTSKGKGKLTFLKERLTQNKEMPSKKTYKKIKDNKLKIVIFDIPEEKRKKRNWLRDVLKNLGFVMLQKSVWIGKNEIPEELIEDLNRLNLLPAVEIFEISQTGSLKQIS